METNETQKILRLVHKITLTLNYDNYLNNV